MILFLLPREIRARTKASRRLKSDALLVYDRNRCFGRILDFKSKLLFEAKKSRQNQCWSGSVSAETICSFPAEIFLRYFGRNITLVLYSKTVVLFRPKDLSSRKIKIVILSKHFFIVSAKSL